MKIGNASVAVIAALALSPVWAEPQAVDAPPDAPGSGAAMAPGTPTVVTAPEAEAAHPPAATARPHTAMRHATRTSIEQRLDERVALLTRELGLDNRQQAEVRRILQVQHDRVRQVWNDPARLPADRIGATQALSERTADEIRAVLSEEQRKQYIAPKLPRTAADHPEHDLDYWMEVTRRSH